MASLAVDCKKELDNNKIIQILNVCPSVDYEEAQQILVGVGGDVEKSINIILNNQMNNNVFENALQKSDDVFKENMLLKPKPESSPSYYDLRRCNENLKHDLDLSMNDQIQLQDSLKEIYNQFQKLNVHDENFVFQFETFSSWMKDILYKHQLISPTEVVKKMENLNLKQKARSFNYEVLD